MKTPTKQANVEITVLEAGTLQNLSTKVSALSKVTAKKPPKPVSYTAPQTVRLKSGCYSFEATKLTDYALDEQTKLKSFCPDQYGTLGTTIAQNYRIVFTQTRIADTLCDKLPQGGINDFWFCGAQVRAKLRTDNPQKTAYDALWLRMATKIGEYRTAYKLPDAPLQVRVEASTDRAIDGQKYLKPAQVSTITSCPLPRQAVAAVQGVAQPDEAERTVFNLNLLSAPGFDATGKQLRPDLLRHYDTQITYLWAQVKDWRDGGCKDFGSRNTAGTFSQLYTNVRTNFTKEMDDALNLNRYIGVGANGPFINPVHENDPARFYAAAFTIGTIYRSEFDKNIPEELNNQDSTKYQPGAKDAIKALLDEVVKKPR